MGIGRDVMHRSVAWAFFISLLVGGCSLASVVPGPIDPPCRAHADPADCQAALEAAHEGMTFDADSYVVVVQPISCTGGQCTTWVTAVPDSDDDCVPSYEVEVARGMFGSWEVTMSVHGDPPCAFEP
jgi:hypothetical protein